MLNCLKLIRVMDSQFVVLKISDEANAVHEKLLWLKGR